MKEILLSIKSQLVYVVENQYKLKAESFLIKYNTPDLDLDLLGEYFSLISDDIVESLQENYTEILDKATYLQSKFPEAKDLSKEDKENLSKETIDFVENDLSQIIYDKVCSNILE